MTMPSTGIFKKIAWNRETTWGALAAAAGSTYLRRTQATFDATRTSFASNEIKTSQQMSDTRLGFKQVTGSVAGELSPGAYSDFISAVLRQNTVAGVTTGAQTTIAAAAGDGSTTQGTFTRSAGSWLTDGFKIGDVVRCTGWTTTATANNTRNYRITALTATVLTVGSIASGTPTTGAEAVVTKVAGDSVTFSVVGKKTMIPTTGQTSVSYTIEQFFSDISQTEVFVGMVPTGFDIQMPASGMSTISFKWLGYDMNPDALSSTTTQYFTTPTTLSTFNALAGVNGTVRVGAVDYGIITAASISVTGNHTSEPVVGSIHPAGVFPGKVQVSGQLTIYFQDNVMRDAFLNETEQTAQLMLVTNNTVSADFINIFIPRLKLTSSSKNDNEKAIVQTFAFVALEQTAGGTGTSASDTTIVYQDSQAL